MEIDIKEAVSVISTMAAYLAIIYVSNRIIKRRRIKKKMKENGHFIEFM